MQIEQKGSTITLSKVFDAPKELVFSMFKNPYVQQWWGPSAWPVSVSEQDFRPGGSWLYNMVGPDGTESWGKALYDEIDEPNKIVYRDYFSNADGEIDKTLPTGTVTMTFEEDDGQTTVTSHGDYGSSEDVQKLVEMGMIEGVKETWGQLEQLLADSQ